MSAARIELTIDGNQVVVAPGTTVFDAARLVVVFVIERAERVLEALRQVAEPPYRPLEAAPLDNEPETPEGGEKSGLTPLLFNNLSALPQLSHKSIVFKQPSGSMFFVLNLPFVFNNSSGSTFIFNISLGQRPGSDLEKCMGAR